jgi:hypothetical protein
MVNVVKYAACALIIQNWPAFFTDISNGFATIANNISSADFINSFKQSYLTNFNSVSSWSLDFLSASVATILTDLILVIVLYLYYLIMLLFGILYTCWGMVLYVIGPMLVALFPSRATAPFAKHYCESLAQWAAWPLLYAVVGLLSTHMTDLTAVATTDFGSASAMAVVEMYVQNIIIACIYMIFLLCLPFIASYMIKGDFGATALATTRSLASMTRFGSGIGKGLDAVGSSVTKSLGGSSNGGGGGSTKAGGVISSGSLPSAGSSKPPPASPPAVMPPPSSAPPRNS